MLCIEFASLHSNPAKSARAFSTHLGEEGRETCPLQSLAFQRALHDSCHAAEVSVVGWGGEWGACQSNTNLEESPFTRRSASY